VLAIVHFYSIPSSAPLLRGCARDRWPNVRDDDALSVCRVAELKGPFFILMGKAFWRLVDDTRDCLSKPKPSLCHFLFKQWIHWLASAFSVNFLSEAFSDFGAISSKQRRQQVEPVVERKRLSRGT